MPAAAGDFLPAPPSHIRYFTRLRESAVEQIQDLTDQVADTLNTEISQNQILSAARWPLFSGVLDQGYWNDEMYTPPSDEAMEWKTTHLKQMVFNMLRKHIKIEPLRWYWHCDRLGRIVWQDFVNGGGPYRPMVTLALPFIGRHLKDSRYRRFARKDKAGPARFLKGI